MRPGQTKPVLLPKNTPIHNGIYLLFCVCYLNSVSFIGLLRIYCIATVHIEVCGKILCSGMELLILKYSKLTQKF